MEFLTQEHGIFLIDKYRPGFKPQQSSEINFFCENRHEHLRAFYRIVQNINKNGGKFFCQTCAMHFGSVKGTSRN